MCYYSQLIKNRKYTKNKKNGGNIPTVTDIRTEYVPIGCGNCRECRKQKQREWIVRLQEHIKTHTNGQYVTLTFSNESIKKLNNEKIKKTNKETGAIEEIYISGLEGYDRDNAIATRAVRLFNERWRKEHKRAVHHWLITELGHKGTENIHIHGIIWTYNHTNIQKHWQYGFVWDGYYTNGKRENYVNNQTISYATKYITKIDQRNKEYRAKILCSPGIGKNYTNTHNSKSNQYNGYETDETYRTETGHKISLPIYYRNKIYTDNEKERLWIQKLDKQERWVDGIRYDISQTDKQYTRAIQEARQKNTQLGYGNRKNENREQYENARREILIETRIRNSK